MTMATAMMMMMMILMMMRRRRRRSILTKTKKTVVVAVTVVYPTHLSTVRPFTVVVPSKAFEYRLDVESATFDCRSVINVAVMY